MTEDEQRRTLREALKLISSEVTRDKFMLLEYLGPIVDGARAALNLNVEQASRLHEMSEEEFDTHLEGAGQSFYHLTICFEASDSGELYSLEFSKTTCTFFDECVEPDVLITADASTLLSLVSIDSDASPLDLLGTDLVITGTDSSTVVEGLGFLCYPPLLRMARSGIDPSSLLSEDADSVIMAAASDLVTKIVRRWIDLQLDSATTQ
ncbi:MAG: hypothetical protein JSW61_04465 [Candidatus Thorarchaeota archaeon]|nr:MAG: hypothetical protein JSW61_04465 [Candidatus Thorarchaeota archaeon]